MLAPKLDTPGTPAGYWRMVNGRRRDSVHFHPGLVLFRVGRSWHTYIINSNLDISKRGVLLLFYLMGTWL